MNDYCDLLGEMAKVLSGGKQPLDYAICTRIERALFITAKTIASTRMNVNISSFTFRARESVEHFTKGKPDLMDSRELVFLAFELRAALSRLTSSDPYIRHDEPDEAIHGRKHAIAMFAKRLRRYSDDLAALLKTEAP